MRTWIVPAIVAVVLVEATDYLGWRQQAWWLLPSVLFPMVLLLMAVRKEITVASVFMAVLISGVLALVLKLSA